MSWSTDGTDGVRHSRASPSGVIRRSPVDLESFAELARLDDYQALAAATNQLDTDLPEGVDPEQTLKRLVPLLGMAGEVGSLLVEFKKHIRDGEAHRLFPD